MSAAEERSVRRRFAPGTTIDDLKAYMVPFVATLGYKLNTEAEFVDEVLASELQILEASGDVYCPCRMRTGDPKEDVAIICPCIPFHSEQFAAMRKCWCGLFIRTDVADGAELLGVIDEPGPGVAIDVPVLRVDDLPPGQVRHVKVGKTDIAIARVGDEFFALSNVCRHAFASLSDGVLEGYEVMCPWHGWRYDVRTGHTDHPGSDVRRFDVTVRDGEVLLRMTAR